MEQLTIRQAEWEDLHALAGLMKEYITDFYGAPEPPEENLQALIQMLAGGTGGTQWVAVSGGSLIGFATLYYTYSTLRASRIAVLNDFYLVAEARGSGAAKQLFEACADFCREQGFPVMSWETAKDNYRAQRFYEQMGGQTGDWLNYSLTL
jgi:GNAT superfamily N-acetyltransferase